jgi:hypothetical protein
LLLLLLFLLSQSVSQQEDKTKGAPKIKNEEPKANSPIFLFKLCFSSFFILKSPIFSLYIIYII